MTPKLAGRRGAGRPGRPGSGGLGNRVVWSFGGQFLSSSGNFLVTAIVLTVASQADYAVFSICFTTYLLAVLLFRALVAIPVAMLYSGPREVKSGVEEEENAAVSFGVLIACGAGMLIAAASTLLDGNRDQFLILAGALPFLLYQDCARYVAFARGCPVAAAQSDGLWLGLQIAGFTAASVAGRASAASLFAVWAISGAVAGGLIGLRLHLPLRVAGAGAWVRGHWQLCRRLLMECVITSGGVYAMLYGLLIVADSSHLGRLRAAQTLLGPVSVVLLGGAALGVPETVRARHDSPRMRRFAVHLSLFLGGFGIVCGLGVYLTLPAFGPHLFPSAWSAARPLIPVLVVFNAALGASTGPISGIRALGDTRWIVRGRSASTLVLLIVGLPAAALVGAGGAVVGLALAETLLAVAAWRHFDRLTAGTPPVPA
jgi:O-antigen/teichoic acid export membrane protein